MGEECKKSKKQKEKLRIVFLKGIVLLLFSFLLTQSELRWQRRVRGVGGGFQL
jgi:hypothetical protein